MEALTKEKFSLIRAEEWESVCKHVDKVVHEYLVKEDLLDDVTEEIAFTVNTGESETSEDSDGEDVDDDDNDLGVQPLPDVA